MEMCKIKYTQSCIELYYF